MAGKQPLSYKEIKELLKLVRAVYKYQSKLTKQNPLADRIKRPQAPAILSESIAAYLAERRKILSHLKGFSYTLGPKMIADVVGEKKDKQIRIEVKGAASEGFQRLSGNDITADYLVVVNYGHYFSAERNTSIEIWTIEVPGRYLKKLGHITLRQIEAKVGEKLIKTRWRT